MVREKVSGTFYIIFTEKVPDTFSRKVHPWVRAAIRGIDLIYRFVWSTHVRP